MLMKTAKKELEAKENEFLYKAQVAVFVAREEKYAANKGTTLSTRSSRS